MMRSHLLLIFVVLLFSSVLVSGEVVEMHGANPRIALEEHPEVTIEITGYESGILYNIPFISRFFQPAVKGYVDLAMDGGRIVRLDCTIKTGSGFVINKDDGPVDCELESNVDKVFFGFGFLDPTVLSVDLVSIDSDNQGATLDIQYNSSFWSAFKEASNFSTLKELSLTAPFKAEGKITAGRDYFLINDLVRLNKTRLTGSILGDSFDSPLDISLKGVFAIRDPTTNDFVELDCGNYPGTNTFTVYHKLDLDYQQEDVCELDNPVFQSKFSSISNDPTVLTVKLKRLSLSSNEALIEIDFHQSFWAAYFKQFNIDPIVVTDPSTSVPNSPTIKNPTVSDLYDNFSNYDGKTISVSGKILREETDPEEPGVFYYALAPEKDSSGFFAFEYDESLTVGTIVALNGTIAAQKLIDEESTELGLPVNTKVIGLRVLTLSKIQTTIPQTPASTDSSIIPCQTIAQTISVAMASFLSQLKGGGAFSCEGVVDTGKSHLVLKLTSLDPDKPTTFVFSIVTNNTPLVKEMVYNGVNAELKVPLPVSTFAEVTDLTIERKVAGCEDEGIPFIQSIQFVPVGEAAQDVSGYFIFQGSLANESPVTQRFEKPVEAVPINCENDQGSPTSLVLSRGFQTATLTLAQFGDQTYFQNGKSVPTSVSNNITLEIVPNSSPYPTYYFVDSAGRPHTLLAAEPTLTAPKKIMSYTFKISPYADPQNYQLVLDSVVGDNLISREIVLCSEQPLTGFNLNCTTTRNGSDLTFSIMDSSQLNGYYYLKNSSGATIHSDSAVSLNDFLNAHVLPESKNKPVYIRIVPVDLTLSENGYLK